MKPYTAEVRREIDWEMVDRGIDFIKRQKTAGKPFFLYLPISANPLSKPALEAF